MSNVPGGRNDDVSDKASDEQITSKKKWQEQIKEVDIKTSKWMVFGALKANTDSLHFVILYIKSWHFMSIYRLRFSQSKKKTELIFHVYFNMVL